ncbi:MAG: chorismate synthase [Lachnospiraceae bacterium]|nr:chorismate synthase [Lachnospiraceae bacterium]
MAGSSFGTIFRVTTWGESHGPGIGAVVDGVPAGLPLDESDIQQQLNRRKPGQSRFATPRKEDDRVRILSGVFEGKTTGAPIALEVLNETQRSSDYSQIASCYRPGHADYTFDQKYGFRDYRGGGRSSARETIGRVAAGAIAQKILDQLGIRILAWSSQIGPVAAESFDPEEIENNPFRLPDAEAAQKAAAYVESMMQAHDSVGGVIECRITGVPAGLGDPVFEKLDANLSKALMSIGAVKGIEIGDGFSVAAANGSANNDPFIIEGNQIKKASNHAGGILGGISDGDTIRIRAAIKPTPSIFQPQDTVNRDKEPVSISIKGRHDPIVVPRAVVVVEAMAAITLVDSLFLNMSCQMDRVTAFYKNK